MVGPFGAYREIAGGQLTGRDTAGAVAAQSVRWPCLHLSNGHSRLLARHGQGRGGNRHYGRRNGETNH